MKQRYVLWVLVGFLLCSCAPEEILLEDSLSSHAAAHGKYFGTAVVHGALFNTDEVDLSNRYNSLVKSQFNIIVPESEMKMAKIWKDKTLIDYTQIDQIADLAVANTQNMRAHVLVWYRSLPEWLVAGYLDGTYSKTQIAQMVAWYVQELMGHFKTKYPGLVVAWDVVNEAIGPNDPTSSDMFGLRPVGTDYKNLNQDFWRLTLGDDYVEKVFAWAHAADPDASLFYNDYHCEYENPKGQAIFNFVTHMKDRGVPIHGIGLQCHFAVSYFDMSHPGVRFSIESISRTVDQWIASGLDVHITEADIGAISGQESRQASFYADLLRNTLLKDGVSSFTTWGFTDLVSWRSEDKALYFDEAINPKTSYYAMLDVLTRWK